MQTWLTLIVGHLLLQEHIITFLDKLSRELETYHCVLDLANAFFSIPIAKESQDQFAFI